MLSYSLLKQDILYNIGLPATTDANAISFVNRHLQTRYQDLLAAFSNWKTEVTQTASTVVSQQFYAYPPGVVKVETATVAQGNIVYPLQVVNSQEQWDYINQYPNTNTFIPQFLFPRASDFGIFPIPQEVNTITFNYNLRDKALIAEDYTTGNATFTNGTQVVTGGGTTWTSDMVGRYIVPANADGFPTGYWYLITAFNSTASVNISSFYEGLTEPTANYIIGQLPYLPEEAHVLISWGVTADWYASRGDVAKAGSFNNMYYTGDPNNAQRGGRYVEGGLIGLRERYAERADRRIVNFNTKSRVGFYPNWINEILP